MFPIYFDIKFLLKSTIKQVFKVTNLNQQNNLKYRVLKAKKDVPFNKNYVKIQKR